MLNPGSGDKEKRGKDFIRVIIEADNVSGRYGGRVETRFPPEPNGYLHIGHVKASMINYHYSRIYEGKMILRFDDTNPSKEKDEYVQSITEDLKTMGIDYDQLSYTSDYFDVLLDWCTKLIKEGKITPAEARSKAANKDNFPG